MSATTLPPAPYQSAMVDDKKMITPAWTNWVRQLFIQTGGTSSTSLASLITTVTNLGLTVTAQAAEITTLQTDIQNLSVGRQL